MCRLEMAGDRGTGNGSDADEKGLRKVRNPIMTAGCLTCGTGWLVVLFMEVGQLGHRCEGEVRLSAVDALGSRCPLDSQIQWRCLLAAGSMNLGLSVQVVSKIMGIPKIADLMDRLQIDERKAPQHWALRSRKRPARGWGQSGTMGP